MAKCGKCRTEGVNVGNSQMTTWDRLSLAQEARSVRNGHPVALVFAVVSVAAKCAFSTVYKCRTCGAVWREWFE